MAYGTRKNFGVSRVAVAPSPAASGLSLQVTAGHGVRFEDPPFNATVRPVDADPTDDNAEVVTVSAVAGDLFTLVREQENSAARAIQVGDVFIASQTAGMWSELEQAVDSTNVPTFASLILGGAPGLIKPAVNSITAIQITNVAGTSILNVDTSNLRVGIGTAAPGAKLDINTGAQTDILLGQWGAGANYNAISLNGTLTAATLTGIFSGAAADGNFYMNVPTGSNYYWRFNNTTLATLSSTLLTIPGGISMNGDITGVGAMDFVPGTAASKVRIDDWGGSTSYGALSFNNVVTAVGIVGLFGSSADSNLYSNVPTGGARLYRINNTLVGTFNATGLAIGPSAPTAVLHIKAGTATANTAPLKFNSGTLLTTAEAGAVEFLTDKFYGTITTGAARKTFAFLESPALVTPNIGVATGTSFQGIVGNVTPAAGSFTTLSTTGIFTLGAPATLKGYTVATLPAGVQGHVAFVTDALAPTFMATVVGGGEVVCVTFYNGTNWVAF